MERRSFLQAAATGAWAATMPSLAYGQRRRDSVRDYAGTPEWWRQNNRWMQLIMVENDPGHYDLAWWAAFFDRTQTNSLCLTAGGLTAYYPSRIPFHHISSWMKPGDDPFGDFARICRDRNIKVIARTDSHTCLADAAAAHPEWLNIDENGKPRRHWEMPETRFVTCAFGPYNFEFMTAVHRELADAYRLDGLFCNRWQGQSRGMCYCNSCQTLFRAYAGMDLPRGGNAPAQAKYDEWATSRLLELWRVWDGVLRRANRHARYFTNTGIPQEVEAKISPLHLIEKQNRRDEPLWNFARAAKETRAIMGRDITLVALDGISSSSQYRISVTTDAEQTLWMLGAVAGGLQPWALKISAVVDDPRWIGHMDKIYAWHARNTAYLTNTANLARVALLIEASSFRQETVQYPDGNAVAGWYQALVEARIPFEMVHRPTLSAETLRPFATLILPNIVRLSDADCAVIRQFVRDGGNIVATFETSMQDEKGAKRADFGLADLFGVSYRATAKSGDNAYLNIDRPDHPIVRDLGDVARIVGTNARVETTAARDAEAAVLTRLPPFPTIPMEEIYPRVAHTDIPEIVLRARPGQGRVVYVPGDIDRSFSKTMLAEHGLLMRNMVDWATAEPRIAAVSGTGVLDVHVWRQAGSLTVHMVNMTNPMLLRGPVRELVPVGPQTVTVQLPAGVTARRARLLVDGRDLPMTIDGRAVTVTVPAIVDHEVVAINV